MINEIWFNGTKIISKVKEGKFSFFNLANGEKIKSGDILCHLIKIKCYKCYRLFKIKFYQGKNGLLKRKYLCQSCGKIGSRNPFYGKKHTIEFKKKLSRDRKGLYVGNKNPMFGKNVWDTYDEDTKIKIKKKISSSSKGKNNPFYGKKHSKKIMDLIIKKTKKWRDYLSEEDRKRISQAQSDAQIRIREKDPEKYTANKRKAAYKSLKSNKRHKMNSIEKLVMNELKRRKLEFKYSVILGYKQFDFGSKKHRILIEVQGDYWHGNPKIYGKNKKKLNIIQKNKIKDDKIKKLFAKKHKMKLFCIWENDIRKNNYVVIDEIEGFIKNVK